DFRVQLTDSGAGGDITVSGPIVSGAGTGADGAKGSVLIRSTQGDITVNGSIDINPVDDAATGLVSQGVGSVTITTQGGSAANITLNWPITVDAKSGSIQILAGNNVTMAAAGDITVNGGIGGRNVPVKITAGGNDITMAGTARIDADAGYIELRAAQDIVLGQLVTDHTGSVGAGTVAVDIYAGMGTITDAGAGDVDVDAAAGGVIFDADYAIGTLLNPIETTVANLDANLGLNGDIHIVETDSVAVGLVEIQGASGDIYLTAGTNITDFDAGAGLDIVTANGKATLTAGGSIGVAGQPLETEIATLVADSTGTGDIYLDEKNGITYENVDTNKGDIVLTYGNGTAGKATATAVDALDGFVSIIGAGDLVATHVYALDSAAVGSFDVTLTSTTGNITLGDVKADYDVTILASGTPNLAGTGNVVDDGDGVNGAAYTQVEAGHDISITASGASGFIGSSADINPTIANNHWKAVDVLPGNELNLVSNGNIQVYQQGDLGSLKINTLNSGGGSDDQIFIGAGGSLTIAGSFSENDDNITLAAMGSFTAGPNDLTIDPVFSVTGSDGSVWLYAGTGDVNLNGLVFAGANAAGSKSVTINADAGSINASMDLTEITAASGVSGIVVLTASSGIGSTGVGFLRIDATTVNAHTDNGDIYIETAGQGGVGISAENDGAGDIFLNGGNETMTLTDIDANNGSITVTRSGVLGDAIVVVSVESDTGVTGTHSVSITNQTGDINFGGTLSTVGHVTGDDDITLTASGGSIVSATGTAAIDITSLSTGDTGHLALYADDSIGGSTANQVLMTEVDSLEGLFGQDNVGNEVFYLDNNGALTLRSGGGVPINAGAGTATLAGNATVDITADSLTLAGLVQATVAGSSRIAIINLTADGTGAGTADITWVAGGAVLAQATGSKGSAAITLDANDDVSIGSGGFGAVAKVGGGTGASKAKATVDITANGSTGDINIGLITGAVALSTGSNAVDTVNISAGRDVTASAANAVKAFGSGSTADTATVNIDAGRNVSIAATNAVAAMFADVALVNIDAATGNVTIDGKQAVVSAGAAADVQVKAAGGSVNIKGGSATGLGDAGIAASGGTSANVLIEAGTDVTVLANGGTGSYGVVAVAGANLGIDISAGTAAATSGSVVISSGVFGQSLGDATVNIDAAGGTGGTTGADVIVNAAGSVQAVAGNGAGDDGRVTITADADVTIAGDVKASAGGVTGDDAYVNIGTTGDHIGGDVTISGSVQATAGTGAGDTAEVNVYTDGNLLINGGTIAASVGAGSGAAQVNLGGTGANQIGGTATGSIKIYNGGLVTATGGTGASDYVKAYAADAIIVGVNGSGAGAINVASATGTATLSGTTVVIGSGTAAGSVKASGSVLATVNITATAAAGDGIVVGGSGVVQAVSSGDAYIGFGADSSNVVVDGSIKADAETKGGSTAVVSIGSAWGGVPVIGGSVIGGSIDINTGASVQALGGSAGSAWVSLGAAGDIAIDAPILAQGSGSAVQVGITSYSGNVAIGPVTNGTGAIVETLHAIAGNGLGTGYAQVGVFALGSGSALDTGNVTINGLIRADSRTNGGSLAAVGIGYSAWPTGFATVPVAGDVSLGSLADITATGGSGDAWIDILSAGDVDIHGDVNILADGATGGSKSTYVYIVSESASVSIDAAKAGAGTIQALGGPDSTGSVTLTASGGDLIVYNDIFASSAAGGSGGAKIGLFASGDLHLDAQVIADASASTGSVAAGWINGSVDGNIIIYGNSDLQALAGSGATAFAGIDLHAGVDVTVEGNADILADAFTGSGSSAYVDMFAVGNLTIDSGTGTIIAHGLGSGVAGTSMPDGYATPGTGFPYPAYVAIGASGSVDIGANSGISVINDGTGDSVMFIAAGTGNLTVDAALTSTASSGGSAYVTILGSGTGAKKVDVGGSVTAASVSGAAQIDIISHGTGASALVVGGSVTAGGSGGDFMVYLDSRGTGGSVVIDGAITAGSGSGSSGASGSVLIQSLEGDITVNGSININPVDDAASALVSQGVVNAIIDTQGGSSANVALNGAMNLAGSSGFVDITAGNNVSMSASGDIIVNGGSGTGAVNVSITAGTGALATSGSINMTDGAMADAGSGQISLDALDDIILGQLITTMASGTAVAIMANGAVIDGGDSVGTAGRTATADIIANSGTALTYIATGSGIGSSGDFIETRIYDLDGSVGSSGSVYIDEYDGIILTSVLAQTGDIVITAGNSAAGDIQVGLVRTNSGNITLDSKSGSITDLDLDTAADIVTVNGTAYLTATGSIGTGTASTAAINTEVSAITGNSTVLGDINIREVDDITLQSVVTNSGDIFVDANDGDITVMTVTAGGAPAGEFGNVTIYALGADKSVFDDGNTATVISGGDPNSGPGSAGATLDIQAGMHVGGTAADPSPIDVKDSSDAVRALDVDVSTFNAVTVSSAQNLSGLNGSNGHIQLYDSDAFDLSGALTLNLGTDGNQVYLGAGTSMNLNVPFTAGSNDLALALYNTTGTLTIGASGQAAASGGYKVEVYSSGDVSLGGTGVAGGGGAINTTGIVNIWAKGDVIDAGSDTTVDIEAQTLNIYAGWDSGKGEIGVGAHTANVAIDTDAATITAQSRGSVGSAQDIVLNDVSTGDVSLTAYAEIKGDIWFNGTGHTSDTVTLVDLKTDSGAITVNVAGSNTDVTVQSVVSDDGSAASNDVIITAKSGDILFDGGNASTGAVSSLGTVYLTAGTGTGNGTVSSKANIGNLDVQAANLVITARESVGAAGVNILETKVNNLEANFGTGNGTAGFYLDNSGALTIGDVSAMIGISAGSGVGTSIGNLTIDITADSITVNEDINAAIAGTGNTALITLDADGAGAGTADVVVNTGVGVTASAGINSQAQITILANSDVDINGGSVKATVGNLAAPGTGAVVTIGTGADKIGGNVSVRNSGSVSVTGGSNAKDMVNVYAAGNITLAPNGFGTGKIQAHSKTGSVLLSGASIVVGSGTAAGSVLATGSVNAKVTLNATGAAGISIGLNGSVLAYGSAGIGASTVSLTTTDAAGDVTINGVIEAGAGGGAGQASLNINSSDEVGMGSAGSIGAYGGTGNGAVSIVANGLIALDNKVYASTFTGSNVSVTATSNGGDITLGSHGTGIHATGATAVATITLDADPGGSVTLDNTVKAEANNSATVQVTAAGDIVVDPSLNGSFVRGVFATGAVSAQIILDANNGGDVTLNNILQANGTASGAVAIDAEGNVTLTSVGSGIFASGAIAAIDIDATGNVSLDEDVMASGAVATVNVYADGTAGITIGPNVDIYVGASGSTTASVTLDTTGGAGDVIVHDRVVAFSTGGSAKVLVDSAKDVTVNQGGTLEATGATLGSVNVEAAGDVAIGVATAGTVTASGAKAVIAIGTGTLIGGTFTLGASGSINASATTQAALVDINAGGEITLDGGGATVLATSTANNAEIYLMSPSDGITIQDGTGSIVASGSGARSTVWFVGNGGDVSIGTGLTIEATDAAGHADILVHSHGVATVESAFSANAGNGGSKNASIIVDGSAGVVINNNLTSTAGVLGYATITILSDPGSVKIGTGATAILTADAATNTGDAAIVNIGTGGAAIGGGITLGNGADVYANAGTGNAAVNMYSDGAISIDGAVNILADSDTKNGDDATITIVSNNSSVSIDAADTGAGTITADAEDNATVTITAAPTAAGHVTLNNNVLAQARGWSGTAVVTIMGGGNASINAQIKADSQTDFGSGAYISIGSSGSVIGGSITLGSNADIQALADGSSGTIADTNIYAQGNITIRGNADILSSNTGSSGADATVTIQSDGGNISIGSGNGAITAMGSGSGAAGTSFPSGYATPGNAVYVDINAAGAVDIGSNSGISATNVSGSGHSVVYIEAGTGSLTLDADITSTASGSSAYVTILGNGAGTKDVIVGGSVTASGDVAQIDIIAHGTDSGALQVSGSVSAIGSGTDFMVYLDSKGVGGYVTVTGSINAGTGSGSAFSSGSVQILSNEGDITIDGAINIDPTAGASGNGAVLITTQGGAADIALNQAINVSAATGSVQILAGNDVTMGSSGAIIVNGGSGFGTGTGDVPVTVIAMNGSITMDANSLIDAGSGTIYLYGWSGIDLGVLSTSNPTNINPGFIATGAIILESYGAITDAGSDEVDIIAPNAGVIIGNPIGFGTTGNPIETTVGSIQATTSGIGDFVVVETDNILVDFVDVNNGDIYLTATAGAINDLSLGDSASDFIAINGTATLIARDEIGTLAQPIETQIAKLYASGSTITIDEVDGIILGDPQAVDPGVRGTGIVKATGLNGSVDIEAGGHIYAYNVLASGGLSLVNIESTGGSITLGEVIGAHDVTITALKNVLDDQDGGSGMPYYTKTQAGNNLSITADSAGVGGDDYYIGTGNGSFTKVNYIDPRIGSQLPLAVDIQIGVGATTLTSSDNIQIYQQGNLSLTDIFTSGGGSGDQILAVAGGSLTVSGSIPEGDDTVWLAAMNGNLTIDAGFTVEATIGSVDLYADGNVILAGQAVGGTTVQVEATDQILDGAGAGDTGVDITAGTSVYLKAEHGIGFYNAVTPLNPAIDIITPVVDADNLTSGGIHLNMLGSLGVGTGAVNIRTAHSLGAGNIWINSGTDGGITLTDVDTETGNITVQQTVAGNVTVINVESDIAAGTGASDVTISTTSGDIVFNGHITSEDRATLTANGGSIISTAGAATDVTARELVLYADNNIGSNANNLVTQASLLEAIYSGDNAGDEGIWLDNSGMALTIGGITAMDGVTTGLGAGNGNLQLDIKADSITVNENVTAYTSGSFAVVELTALVGGITVYGGGGIGGDTYVFAVADDKSETYVTAVGDILVQGGLAGAAYVGALADNSGSAIVNVTSNGGGVTVDANDSDAFIATRVGSGLGNGSVSMVTVNANGGDVTVLGGDSHGSGAIQAWTTGNNATQTINVTAKDNILINAEMGDLAEIWLYGSGSAAAISNLTANMNVTATNGSIRVLGGSSGAGTGNDAWLGAFAGGDSASVSLDVTAKGDIIVEQRGGGDAGLGGSNWGGSNSTVDVEVVSTSGNVSVSGSSGSIYALGGGTGLVGTTVDLSVTAAGNVTVLNSGAIYAKTSSSVGILPAGTTGAKAVVNGANISVIDNAAIYASGGVGYKDIVDVNAAGTVLVDTNGAIYAHSQTGSVDISGKDITIGNLGIGNVSASGSVKALVTITSAGGTSGITVGASGTVITLGGNTSTINMFSDANVINQGSIKAESTSGDATVNVTASGAVGITVGGTILSENGNTAADTGLIVLDSKGVGGDVIITGLVQAGGTGHGVAKVNINSVDMVSVNQGGSVKALGQNYGSVNIQATGDVSIGASGAGLVWGTAADTATVFISASDITIGGAVAGNAGSVGAAGGKGVTTTLISTAGDTGITIGSFGTVAATLMAADNTQSATVDMDVFNGGLIINGTVGAFANQGSANVLADVWNGAGGVNVGTNATITTSGTTTAAIAVNANGGDATGEVYIDGSLYADGGSAKIDVNSLNTGSNALVVDSNASLTSEGNALVLLNSKGVGGDIVINGDILAHYWGMTSLIDVKSLDDVTMGSSASMQALVYQGYSSIQINAGGDVILDNLVKAYTESEGEANVEVHANGAQGITVRDNNGTGQEEVQAMGMWNTYIWLDSAGADADVTIYGDVLSGKGSQDASVLVNSADQVILRDGASITAQAGSTGQVVIDASGNVVIGQTGTAGIEVYGSGWGYSVVDIDAWGNAGITLGTNGHITGSFVGTGYTLITINGSSLIRGSGGSNIDVAGTGIGPVYIDGDIRATQTGGAGTASAAIDINSNNTGAQAIVIDSNGSLSTTADATAAIFLDSNGVGGGVINRGFVQAGSGAGFVALVDIEANDGNITQAASGTITGSAANTVSITLNTGSNTGNIDLQGRISANGGPGITGSVALAAAQNITIGVGGDIIVNNGSGKGDVDVAVIADVKAGSNLGAITMVDGALIDAGSGTITMRADGDILLSGLVTTGTGGTVVDITSHSKGILDNGDTYTEITAIGAGAWVSLQASDFIGRVKNDEVIEDPEAFTGATGRPETHIKGDAIETSLHNLIAVTVEEGGEIAIDNTGNFALTLGQTVPNNPIIPSAGEDASMWIRNDEDITVANWTVDGNDNVALIATTGNVTIPDSGFTADTALDANFVLDETKVDISVGTGTVRLEASTKVGTGSVRDSAGQAITVIAHNLIIKTESLSSELITDASRFGSGTYAYNQTYDPGASLTPLTNATPFHVVARLVEDSTGEAGQVDAEVRGSGESFSLLQTNGAAGNALDLTITDIDGDGDALVINGDNAGVAGAGGMILVYVANGHDNNTDGSVLTVDGAVSANNGDIVLWVDNTNGKRDGEITFAGSSSITTDPSGDELGALFIYGNTKISGVTVQANKHDMIILSSTANHIIIDDAQVGAGTVTLNPGGSNEWDIIITKNGSLTVNGGDLFIQNADEFRMESDQGLYAGVQVNDGSVNINDVNVMLMQPGTFINADKGINVGQNTGSVYAMYMAPTATMNAGAGINISVKGDILLGNLNSDVDGIGGGDITITSTQGPNSHPHYINPTGTGSAYNMSWGSEENGASGTPMIQQFGSITVNGVINPNENNVSITATNSRILNGGGQVVNTNMFTATALDGIGVNGTGKVNAMSIDARGLDIETTGAGADVYITNTPTGGSDVQAEFNTVNGDVVYSQAGGNLILVDWGADADGKSVSLGSGNGLIDPPDNVTIAADVAAGNFTVEANGSITQGPAAAIVTVNGDLTLTAASVGAGGNAYQIVINNVLGTGAVNVASVVGNVIMVNVDSTNAAHTNAVVAAAINGTPAAAALVSAVGGTGQAQAVAATNLAGGGAGGTITAT
ncbi:MAG: hypothetical protein JEZ02_19490, partial [Desulfatibacillum sp.]|nr:hypothetical protein [Desulfatibacillum sp.]